MRDEDYASRHEHRADTRSSVFIPLINANDSQPSSKRFRCAPSRVTPRWTLAVLSKIYRSSDVNVPVDSNFQICQPIFRCLSIAVVLFRACPAAATLRDTSKHESGIVPRCMDVIKIFRARMKSYRSTWFVILVARYRVTIAKLHSLSDPLPSSLQFITRKLPRWFLTLAEQLD